MQKSLIFCEIIVKPYLCQIHVQSILYRVCVRELSLITLGESGYFLGGG